MQNDKNFRPDRIGAYFQSNGCRWRWSPFRA